MPVSIRKVAFTDPDFAKCLAIRMAVFVGEQHVPEAEERDAQDATALHFLAERDGAPLGTARLLLQGSYAKITRVAVLRAARSQGIGAALMRHIETTAPQREFRLDAQIQAVPFYERLGYAATGAVFLEAGIPHRHMVKVPAVPPDSAR
jgi:predicted GNAT family N-acyltransferase